jgi:hypothetical protein
VNVVATLNKKLTYAGCATVAGILLGGFAARLPNRIPGTSGLVPSGVLEWFAAIVVLSAGLYSFTLLFRYMRSLGVLAVAVTAGVFAACVPFAIVSAILLWLGFSYA